MKRYILTALLFAALACQCAVASDLTQATQQECERRGDYVEHVDGSVQSRGSVTFGGAVRAPVSDANKFYVSVVEPGSFRCVPCEKLKRDFATSPHLQAFVNTKSHKDSFAHYNVYNYAKQPNGWRFEGASDFKEWPVTIISPPLKGKYAAPEGTYLEPIYGYDGPKAHADKIRQRIAEYTGEINSQAKRPLVNVDIKRTQTEPPFALPDEPELDDSEKKAEAVSMVATLLYTLIMVPLAYLLGIGVPAALLAYGIRAFLTYRASRVTTGQKVYTSDDLVDALKMALEKMQPTKSAP